MCATAVAKVSYVSTGIRPRRKLNHNPREKTLDALAQFSCVLYLARPLLVANRWPRLFGVVRSNRFGCRSAFFGSVSGSSADSTDTFCLGYIVLITDRQRYRGYFECWFRGISPTNRRTLRHRTARHPDMRRRHEHLDSFVYYSVNRMARWLHGFSRRWRIDPLAAGLCRDLADTSLRTGEKSGVTRGSRYPRNGYQQAAEFLFLQRGFDYPLR